MVLVCFLIFTLTIAASVRFSAFDIFQSWGNVLHFHCLERLPKTSLALGELQALVCGKNFASASTSSLYLSTGLIHLFVVSGAHLIVLERLLKIFSKFIFPLPQVFIFALLIIYCFVCNLNPPVVRALFAFLLGSYLISHHLYWSDDLKILIVGLFSLLFNPAWIISAGLQLSWLAALALAIPKFSNISNDRSWLVIFKKQFLFFILLAPLIFFFQIPNPLTTLTNLFFAPLLEMVLFPLGLITWCLPQSHFFFDFSIVSIRWILQQLHFEIHVQNQLNLDLLPYVGWTWIFLIHFHLHFVKINFRRTYYD